MEPHFHHDSYGYRPGKSAIKAVGVARQRCWWYDWVVDLDIKGFFDNLDHDLVIRAVKKHTDCKWILLYIERWLKAPAKMEDGTLMKRGKGTPQGGVASPLLANLFLHYAFDEWMKRNHPTIPFERYADDAIVHCCSEKQSKLIKTEIERRLSQCKLELHPDKTKIVYCKDGLRRGSYQHESFDFLGYTFRPRRSKSLSGNFFVNFSPAVSNKASVEIRRVIRSWLFHRRSDQSLEDLSRFCNPILRGWINYYGQYYKSALYPIFDVFNRILVRCVRRKYKRFRFHQRRATRWLRQIAYRQPALFAHWKAGFQP